MIGRMRMGMMVAALALAAMPACAETLTARGQEPSWSLVLEGETIRFDAPGLGLGFAAKGVTRGVVAGQPTMTAQHGADTLQVTVTERACADTMSGMPFPIGVEVAFGGRTFTGCGGDSLTAIEGGWRVVRFGADMPPEGMIFTIMFERDGRVSGRSGCNRYSGSFTLTGEGLSFAAPMLTRMACAPPEMEAEKHFLEMLRSVTRVTTDENARLRLMAGDDTVFVIDRAD